MCLHRVYELFVQRMKYNEKTEKETILNVCLVESTALLPSGLTDDQSNQILIEENHENQLVFLL